MRRVVKYLSMQCLATFIMVTAVPLPDANSQGWGDRFRQKTGSFTNKASNRVSGWSNRAKNKTRSYIKKKKSSFTNRARNETRKWSSGVGTKVRNFGEKVKRNSPSIRNRVKQGTRAITGQASEYGKHLGNRVRQTATGIGHQVHSAVSAQSERINQTVRELKSRGHTAVRNVSVIAKKYGDNAGKQIVSLYNRHGSKIATAVSAMYEKHGPSIGERMKLVADRTRNWASGKMTKTKVDKAVFAAVAASSIYSRFNDKVKTRTKNTIEKITNTIQVKDRNGRVASLNDYMKTWINTKAPALKGTSIAEDPVEAITYGVLFRDTDYIVNDLRIVRTPGGQIVSIRDRVEQTGSLDVDATLRMIEVVDNVETLSDREASPEDMVIAAKMLQKVNQTGYPAH